MGKVKNEKIKKKSKKQSNDGSDEEDYGTSLDKLKEIDPEFYKVRVVTIRKKMNMDMNSM